MLAARLARRARLAIHPLRSGGSRHAAVVAVTIVLGGGLLLAGCATPDAAPAGSVPADEAPQDAPVTPSLAVGSTAPAGGAVAQATSPISPGGAITEGVGAGDVGASEALTVDNSVLLAPEGQVVDMPDKPHPLRGQQAPDFTMRRLDNGENMSLSDLRGKPVVVNFWATWCAPCRAEMPWLQAAYQDHADQGLVILAVDAGEKVPADMVETSIQRFVDSAGMTFPVLLGDNTYDIQKEWSVYGLPANFLIDAEGTVVDFQSGGYPNHATFEDRLKRILPDAG